MSDSIVISGTGLITPLGNGVSATWDALLAGRSIRTHGRVSLPDAVMPTQPGEGRSPGAFDDPCASQRWTTARASAPDRVSALAMMAARDALQQRAFATFHAERWALVVGTSKGPVDAWLDDHTRHVTAPPSTSDNARGRSGSSGVLAGTDMALGLHTTADYLASDLGIAGPRLTISAACASGLAAVIRAVMMLRDGSVDQALVVAAESSLHPVFLGSFKRLGVLAADGEPVRPLDQHRRGFHISEAAAAVWLERRQPERGEIVIDRFALGGDAYHLTGMDPQGRVLRNCLTRAIAGQPVELIQAHATGTPLNDPVELAAFEDSLAGSQVEPPTIYSHKAAIGHSLGAAGLISIVLNCRMHAVGRVPGNIHTIAPLPVRRTIIAPGAVSKRITRSVAVAAGFGGATAAVSLVSA